MHHTIAWTANASNTTEVDLTPVADPVIPVTAANHFLPQKDQPILYIGAASPNLQRARITTPSLALVTTPFIQPINQAATFGIPQRLADYSAQPLMLRALEEIALLVTQTGGAAEFVTGVAGLLYQFVPPMPGTVWTLRGTSSTAAVARVWTQLTVTWQNQLPTATFAVVGNVHFSANAMASRLIFENQVPRPGSLSIQSLTNFNDRLFDGSSPETLGEWGRFHNYIMPLVEVLCNAADATHEVYLDIMRVA